jgi:general secretion pathway protein J
MTRRCTVSRSSPRRRGYAPRQPGFTLLELLVALFIAALLFAMGYSAIKQAADGREALQQHQARLLEVQTAMRVLEQDFMQLVPRPTRQPIGASYDAALVATATNQPVVALTRGGWTNPNGLQRAGLQRVAYFFENGTLRREYWTVLDPTQSNTTLKRDLIARLKAVQFRFMDPAKTWQDQWPPLSNTGGQFQQQMMLRGRPIAVEITLDTEDMGKLVRILEIPG